MSNQKIIETYKKRARSYSKDMSWLEKPLLFEPLSIPAFGGKKALDACSGTGCVASHLRKHGWDVTAVDVCEEMLQQVEHGVFCVVSDIAGMPFDDSEFDISVCRQGLQYTNVEQALKSLFRVTKSKVILGHITIEDSIDLPFWENYFSIASPGRKHVFLPGDIKTYATKLGWSLEEERIIYDSASLLSPIQYLDENKLKALQSIVKNTTQEFKDRNGIIITNEDIVYKRRWEFQVYIKV